jgi:hypothetical protein
VVGYCNSIVNGAVYYSSSGSLIVASGCSQVLSELILNKNAACLKLAMCKIATAGSLAQKTILKKKKKMQLTPCYTTTNLNQQLSFRKVA